MQKIANFFNTPVKFIAGSGAPLQTLMKLAIKFVCTAGLAWALEIPAQASQSATMCTAADLYVPTQNSTVRKVRPIDALGDFNKRLQSIVETGQDARETHLNKATQGMNITSQIRNIPDFEFIPFEVKYRPVNEKNFKADVRSNPSTIIKANLEYMF